MNTPLGDFGPPPDAVAWGALAIAVVALVFGRSARAREVVGSVSDRMLVSLLAVLAALLSAGYVALYLRGGPRIIDGAAYFLEARSLSQGTAVFDVPTPTGSFRGRFLLSSPDGSGLSVIFPPGYPLVLALGFLVGHPMAVGPAIAAVLVLATYALSLAAFEDRRVARVSAAASVLCAVLRYHTADTLSHGWSACLLAVGLWGALRGTPRHGALVGLAVGWLVATRPVTGCLGFLLVAIVVARRASTSASDRRRYALALAAGAALPMALLLIHQRSATGEWLRSLQVAYYDVSDGPTGCFRYGFGDGVGCRFEHGSFVTAHLARGYGFVAAAGTTLRRLKMHLPDALNVELGFPLLVWALVRAPRSARVLVFAVVGIVVAYVPFYFDGNYPGGGARFYADALPCEIALLSWALVRLGMTRYLVPVALAGFALHTSYDHLRLAHREGGRPMYEPHVLDAAGVSRGLVFVDTDHGFLLGHDPAVRNARSGIVVARRRRDAQDFLLWDGLGRPEAFLYSYDPLADASTARVTRFVPSSGPSLRFEAENQWPPLGVGSGWVEPVFPPCASNLRALALNPDPASRAASIRLEIVAPETGSYLVAAGWATLPAGAPGAVLSVPSAGVTDISIPALPGGAPSELSCGRSEPRELRLTAGRNAVEIRVPERGMLDFLEIARR